MHILLLEPDNILAKLYTAALEPHGHSVDHTASAQSAISKADNRRPDMVVMELQLSQHSGAAFLYEFRSYHDWLTVPVIVNTMVPPTLLQAFRPALIELGVTECLYKPQVSLRKLAEAVAATVPVVPALSP